MKAIILFAQTTACALLLGGCSQLPTTSSPTDNVSVDGTENQLIIEQWQDSDSEPNRHETIWARIVAGYKLDIAIEHPKVTAQLNWYKSHQEYLNRVAERGKRYLHFIAEQVEARDIPGEITLLPIVESAFDPFAMSHSRASGVWQFMPATGHHFGLIEDAWSDGRRDIRASTEAALSYLNALQREFNGDWLLALAAYNSGPGTVRKAMRNNQNRGKATDFWSLDLPRETRDYVPKLIALAKLISEPEQYGITLLDIPDEPYFAIANTGGQIDLAKIAELAQIPIDEVYQLNPSYSSWATQAEGPHEVLVPVEAIDTFNQQIANFPPSERIKWHRYKVKKGDNLNSIAQHFQTTITAIKQANNLRQDLIQAGQILSIPGSHLSAEHYSHSADQRLSRLIAARQPKGAQKLDYIVQSGDTFWGISRQFNVSASDLARWNGITTRDSLQIGQNLIVWSKENYAPMQRSQIIRKIRYTVRPGDSLARISQHFKVSVADVQRWNSEKTNAKYLRPGQVLTLHVNIVN